MNNMKFPIRINKYLRDKGFASRREADLLIEQKKVFINNELAKTGMMVEEKDIVKLNKAKIEAQHIYLAYHKPKGLSTQDHTNRKSIINEWKPEGLFPVGRLDKASSGLIILTNDGRVTTQVLGANSSCEKEYIVNTREKLRSGIPVIFEKGMVTKTLGTLLPVRSRIINSRAINMILQEGKRHQIRIMLSDLGYTTTTLKRVRIGSIELGDLEEGQTRNLTKEEESSFFA